MDSFAEVESSNHLANTNNNNNNNITSSSSSSTSSRYENQKRRDWNTFCQYLKNHKPPLSLSRCSGAHVLEFLRYLDQFGQTKIHTPICPFYGHPNPPAPCPCPLRQAWGSLDALIGRLRAAYEENGGKPEMDPFGARAVRLYLREVRDLQSKARGVSYEKKKRKRPPPPPPPPPSTLSASDVILAFQNIENIAAKKPVQDTSNVVKGQMHCIVGGDDIFHERDTKRQRKLNCGLSEMSLESHGQILQRCPSSEIVATSNCNLEYKICESPRVVQPKAVIDRHPMEGSVCAFCHSPKTIEKTGPFLYFANGREVVGNVTSLSKIICVHSKCIEWTPQVYYEGDTIKNLDTELARATKLKCSSCGVKGAALGCYVTSCRRSYHVPCAFEIQDCRWDMENFVMLCPIHKSVKFPSEKSKSRKKIRREVHPQTSPLTTGQSTFWVRSSDGPKEWVLCGSALSSEEKYMLVKFADMCGATVCKFWKPNVTHVVAATDVKGACTRTMKVLMASLSGKWILTMDWVKACVAANGPVNEELYEISLDNYGCSGGPKAGRLRASTNAPKLFDGFKFYLSGGFMPAYKSDLLDLIEKAGGTIIQSKEQLVKQSHAAQETRPPSLVVYNCDLPQGCTFEEESSILQRRSAEADDLAKQIGFQTVQHTWILESIAACKVVPFF